MKVLLLESGKYAQEIEIDGSLESMQNLVGGSIEAVYPFEDRVAVVCDDEGLLKQKVLNRAFTEDIVIAGTCFICGIGESDFISLSDNLMEKYKQKYYYPELFLRDGNQLQVVQVREPEWKFVMERNKQRQHGEKIKRIGSADVWNIGILFWI